MNEVIEIPEKVSWTTMLEKLEKGEELKTLYSNRSTIATRICKEMKWKYEDRIFRTRKSVELELESGCEIEYLIVKRIL